jgi:predicted transcriptional regulator of viral defense system
MVTRIKRGLWAVTRHPDFSPFALVPYLFAHGQKGYVSLLTALNLHGMIEQIPRSIQIATTQRPRLKTPVATFEVNSTRSRKNCSGDLSPTVARQIST